jgi:hypothetical protein
MGKEKTSQDDESVTAGWTRTTVVIREDQMEKLKILSWWENATIKDLFHEMIEQYLSSKSHLDRLLKERNKNLESKRRSSLKD